MAQGLSLNNDSSQHTSPQNTASTNRKKSYVVFHGREPGVYESWSAQVNENGIALNSPFQGTL